MPRRATSKFESCTKSLAKAPSAVPTRVCRTLACSAARVVCSEAIGPGHNDGALPSWNGAYSYGEPSGVPRRLSRILAAPVAQLDRAPDYESGGQEFESLRARQRNQSLRRFFRGLSCCGLQAVCKLGCFCVLKQGDSLAGENTSAGKVLVEDLRYRLEGMAGDGGDLRRGASSFCEQGHGGAAQVVEVQVRNASVLRCGFPLCLELAE
jgi:hypothetical protein